MQTEKKYKFEIPEGKKKERIDLFLTNSIENATRNKIQKLIQANLVFVNEKNIKPNYKIQPLDVIEITIPISPRPEKTLPEPIPLNIVYEDEYLLIVNKPAGMVTHPAFGNYTGTLVNALIYHTNNLSTINTQVRPGIVHRLDKDTSGLLVVAKDDYTHSKLAKQFSTHSIEREYWSVVWGKFKNKKGEINKNIVRNKSDRKKFTVSDTVEILHRSSSEHPSVIGKSAITYYEVLDEFEFTTLLKVKLKTGRTHQIRVHLSSIGHPVFGDGTYGGRKIVYGNQSGKQKQRVENLLKIMPTQALHAKTLGFIHPYTNEYIRFNSELPDNFKLLLEKLKDD
ncbi:MAG: RluA family pseudouridine synthase [Ignavibacterium sp.]